MDYPNAFKYHFSVQDQGLFGSFDDISFTCPHGNGSDKECRKYYIEDEIMYKVSLKIERATKMQIRVKGSD